MRSAPLRRFGQMVQGERPEHHSRQGLEGNAANTAAGEYTALSSASPSDMQHVRRRYAVKMVTTGSPGWSGTLWAVGCKHLSSVDALFARKAAEVGRGDGLMLFDREQKKVLRSVGSSDPKKTAAWFGW